VSSEFANRAWLALSRALGIIDPKGVSNRVSNEPIVPVVGLDLGMLSYQKVSCAAQITTVAAISTILFPIVSPVITPSPSGLTSFPNNLELETLIFGFRLSVEIPNAGTADLKYVNTWRDLGTDPTIPVVVRSSYQQRFAFFDYAEGNRFCSVSYGPSIQRQVTPIRTELSPDSPIWVPAGGGFAIGMDLDPIDNFQAGCIVTGQAIGVQFPKGVRGPFM